MTDTTTQIPDWVRLENEAAEHRVRQGKGSLSQRRSLYLWS